MSSPTLAEQSRREGVPVVEIELGDGRLWGFALPEPLPCPAIFLEADTFGRPVVRIEQVTEVGYSLEIRRLWDAVRSADPLESPDRRCEAFRRMAISLLRSAHELDGSQAEILLDPGRVDLGRIARTLIPAAFGGQADLTRSGGR
jgi:hypothetical protein